jgi:hypothetical protein
MRNPDKWVPPGSDPGTPSNSRRAALVGLALIALLIIGGLILTHVMGGMTRLQDCAVSGRSNCSVH